MGLTLKQKKFVDHYLVSCNATEAAMHAFDVASRDTARSIGSEYLAKPNIKQAIKVKLLETHPDSELFVKARLYELAQDGKSEKIQFDATVAIAELLGMYEKKEKQINVGVNISLPSVGQKVPKYCKDQADMIKKRL